MSDNADRGQEEPAEQLRESIRSLRQDLQARTDAVLEQVAVSLELLLALAEQARDEARSAHRRLESLEASGAAEE